MGDVLRELDRGPSALPAGSHVTLFNMHDPDTLLADMLQWPGGPPRNIKLRHVKGNPLHRNQLEQVWGAQACIWPALLCRRAGAGLMKPKLTWTPSA